MKDNRTHLKFSVAFALMFVALTALDARAQAQQPNIVVIWNNNAGYRNISPNNHSILGLQDSEHRSQGRHRLPQLQWTTEPPREACSVNPQQRADPQRPAEGRRARRVVFDQENMGGATHDWSLGRGGFDSFKSRANNPLRALK